MTYHDPASLHAVRLADSRGLSVVLALTDAEDNFLVVGEEAPLALVLDGDCAWQALPVATFEERQGLLVEGVRIELDVRSRFDAEVKTVAGALIRRDGTLSVAIRSDGSVVGEGAGVELLRGLVDSPGVAAGFTRWRVVKGDGDATQTILEIDAAEGGDDDSDNVSAD